MDRQNGVPASDSLLYRVNNQTQRLSFSTNYNFDISGTRNAVTLNFTTYGRDEEINPGAQSDFNLYGIGLRTNYSIPLISRLNYSLSENDIGTSASLNQSNTSVSTFLIGIDYVLNGIMGGDVFKPFVNFRIQNVKTKSNLNEFETGRNNYTIGLAYQSPTMGILSIRWDQITYDNANIDFNDTILNARYTYNF
jgi:hypothetical protein